MLPIMRVAVLLAFAYGAFALMGEPSSTAALASLGDEPAPACKGVVAADELREAIDAVDYAGAVLIANGEMYHQNTIDELRSAIGALPAFEMADGISGSEAETLDSVLRLGRQLTYATAADKLETLLAETPTAVRVASAGNEIDFGVLEQFRGQC